MTTPEELDTLQAELRIIGCHSNGDARCTCSIGADADAAITALRARVAELEAQAAALRACVAGFEKDRDLWREAKEAVEIDVDREYKRATAAEAELARRGQGVQVNLVWEDLDGYAWRATAPLFGSFRVERYSNGPWQALWSVPGYCAAFVDGGFATAEDAKQAIEARIRAALVSPGDGCACGGKGCSACDPVSHCQQCGQFRGMDHACPAPPASEPSEYEKKVAQMKEDFPNGI